MIKNLFAKKPPTIQKQISTYSESNPLKLLYVSTIFDYKHQINVVESVVRLRHKGFPIVLELVGGVGQKKTGKMLAKKIKEVVPNSRLITWSKDVGLNGVVDYYHSCDVFIFASSCENMPNILIEAMASGLPIVCSTSEPMPEFLEDAGYYFNPENITEIEQAVEKMLTERDLRANFSSKAFSKAGNYSWEVCADKTFNFLFEMCKKD